MVDEIINEMRSDDWFISNDIIENNRMFLEEFAERFHEKQVKNCALGDVVGQSEQLKAFADFLFDKEYLVKRSVDDVLNEFNSLD